MYKTIPLPSPRRRNKFQILPRLFPGCCRFIRLDRIFQFGTDLILYFILTVQIITVNPAILDFPVHISENSSGGIAASSASVSCVHASKSGTIKNIDAKIDVVSLASGTNCSTSF